METVSTEIIESVETTQPDPIETLNTITHQGILVELGVPKKSVQKTRSTGEEMLLREFDGLLDTGDEDPKKRFVDITLPIWDPEYETFKQAVSAEVPTIRVKEYVRGETAIVNGQKITVRTVGSNWKWLAPRSKDITSVLD